MISRKRKLKCIIVGTILNSKQTDLFIVTKAVRKTIYILMFILLWWVIANECSRMSRPLKGNLRAVGNINERSIGLKKQLWKSRGSQVQNSSSLSKIPNTEFSSIQALDNTSIFFKHFYFKKSPTLVFGTLFSKLSWVLVFFNLKLF